MQETNDILTADFERDYMTNDATAETLIFMGGRDVLSINGQWNYTIDQYNTCLRQKWFNEIYYDADGRTLPIDYSFRDWDTVTLPCSMNLEKPEYFWYEGPFVFTRCFNYDVNTLADNKVFLRIGAANYLCRVFINGHYVCQHYGGSTPFMYEVTEYLHEENRIIIVSDNTRNHSYVPTENTDWFNYSGIYRDIELVTVPNRYIKKLQVSLVPGLDYKKIRISVEVDEPNINNKLHNTPNGIFSETTEHTVSIQIGNPTINKGIEPTDVNNRILRQDSNPDIYVDVPIIDGKGEVTVDAEVMLWSPESPVLYEVVANYGTDKVTDLVGFREITVQGRDIILNGKKLFLHGISVHEDSEFTGKALTEEERIEIIRTAKKLGANYLRLAHYPHHENMAKLCDKYGLLAWEEIPVYWAIDFTNPRTIADAKNQLTEVMTRDYNRASVIIWSVGNENPDSDERFNFMSGLADLAHSYDNTRMVSAACLCDNVTISIKDRLADKLDIIGINEYVGWYSPNFDELSRLFYNSNPSKPVIITEFGADATIGYHGSVDEKGTEECQAEVYRRQVEVLKNIPYIKGMTPWILFDFRCPRRTAKIQGFYNRKGLASSDRKTLKPAFYVLQDFYKNL